MINVSMGLLLAFLIGAGCRFFDVPIPGPQKLVGALLGALLLVSMTTGYIAVDKLLASNVRVLGKGAATTRGPTGETVAAGIQQAEDASCPQLSLTK